MGPMRATALAVAVMAGACTFGSAGGPGGTGPAGSSDDGRSPPGTTDPSTGTTAPSLTATSGAEGDSDTAAIVDTGADSTSTGPVPSTSSSTDTGDATGSGSSGGTTGEPALPTGPFDPPVAITELNSDADDDDASVTADELYIVFNSARSGTSDIWWSSRESTLDPWDPPQPLDAFNVGYITGPSVTPDGLVLLWATNVAPSQGMDVWMATRANVSDAWGAAQHVPELASNGADIAPRWYPALGVAWLCSDRAGTLGGPDVWLAPWPLGDPAPGAVVHVPELSTSDSDCAIGLSADGREAFLETTRPGGSGDWDLWRVVREDPAEPFAQENLEPVAELNTASLDIDPWPSADGHRLYMASDRDGSLDLYVAHRDD